MGEFSTLSVGSTLQLTAHSCVETGFSPPAGGILGSPSEVGNRGSMKASSARAPIAEV